MDIEEDNATQCTDVHDTSNKGVLGKSYKYGEIKNAKGQGR